MKKEAETTELYGLVLAGGRSSRMGMDKGNITYHQKPQREHLYELLSAICPKTYLSIRSDQQQEIKAGRVIVDNDRYRGPFNGLLSAHMAYPQAAWLVLACDLPLANKKMIEALVNARDQNAVATAMATRSSGLPEPLAAIWEPHGLQEAISYLEHADSSCPRKFLLQNTTTLVYARDDQWLYNANSLEEFREARSKISGL